MKSLAGAVWLRGATLILVAFLSAPLAVDAKSKDKSSQHNGETPSGERREVAPGLLRLPYVQAVGTDSALVVWDAPGDGTPRVDYGSGDSLNATVDAQSDGARRVAVLRGLLPGTLYRYQVRAGSQVLAAGPGFAFRTDGGKAHRTFSVFVTGDIGDEGGDQGITANSVLSADPRPELGILVGDIVYKVGSAADYDARLMNPCGALFATVPVWPALGNHDWKSDPEKNFCREWYLPGNEHYYSFEWGSAHFVALDSRDGNLFEPDAQMAWLEQDLTAHADAEWTFVYYHHPGVTCTYKKNAAAVIARILPVLDRHHVDVVFNGHAHTYERLYPLRDGKPVDTKQDPHYVDPQGTIYIVSGAGAQVKEGRLTTMCGPTAFYKDRTIVWTQVLVDKGLCTIRTVESASGKLVDEITIRKTRLETDTAP